MPPTGKHFKYLYNSTLGTFIPAISLSQFARSARCPLVVMGSGEAGRGVRGCAPSRLHVGKLSARYVVGLKLVKVFARARECQHAWAIRQRDARTEQKQSDE